MRIIENIEANNDTHGQLLGNLLDECTKAVFCSGWLKASGVKLIAVNLRAAMSRGASIRICSNSMHTYSGAIKALKNAGVTDHVVINHKIKYVHGKVYYFEKNGTYKLLIGSANIALGGLANNDEVSALVDGVVGDLNHVQLSAYWDRLDSYARDKEGG